MRSLDCTPHNGGMTRAWLLLPLILVAACTSTPQHAAAPTRSTTATSSAAPKPSPTSTVLAKSWPVPDDTLTPGQVTPGCTYPRSVAERVVTQATRDQAAAAYHYTGPPGLAYLEFDHRIPFSLCGSNGLKNIWPEKADGVTQSTYVHNRKDQLEAFAATQVRYKHWTLTFAQQVFEGDWRLAWCKYLHYPGVIC